MRTILLLLLLTTSTCFATNISFDTEYVQAYCVEALAVVLDKPGAPVVAGVQCKGVDKKNFVSFNWLFDPAEEGLLILDSNTNNMIGRAMLTPNYTTAREKYSSGQFVYSRNTYKYVIIPQAIKIVR